MGILDWANSNKMMAMGILNSLPMLTAKTKDDLHRAQQNASSGLLNFHQMGRQQEQDALDSRFKNAQINHWESKNSGDGFTIEELGDGRKYYVSKTPGVEPQLVNPNIDIGSKSPFKNKKEELDMQLKIQDSFNKQTKPDQKRVDSFDSATQVIRSRGGFEKLEGADDTLLMKAFANMLLPNEAVMSDDLRIIAQQSGIPGEFQNFLQRVGGGGQLKPEERARIYQTMEDMFYTSMRGMENTKAGLFPMIQQGQFDYNSVFPQTGYPIATPIPKGLLETPTPRPGKPTPNDARATAFEDSLMDKAKRKIQGVLGINQ